MKTGHLLTVGALLAVSLPGPTWAQQSKPVAKRTTRTPAASAPLAALFNTYSEEHARLFPAY